MLGLSKRPSTSSDPGELLDCIMLLLKAIQSHVVVADKTDAERFRTELDELENRFEPENTRGLVDAAIGIVEHYADRANNVIGQQRSGLMTVVSDLTKAMSSLPDVQKSFDGLNAVEAQIENVSTDSELQSSKVALRHSVMLARSETLQQRQSISDMISATIKRMRTGPGRDVSQPAKGDSTYSLDALTGLPGRNYAEAELARMQQQFPTCQVAAFIVKRFQLINAKFGFRRGDEVLLSVVQYLAQAMPEFNNLFRWTPCTFLTIASPNMLYEEVRRKVQLIDLHRMTVTLEWDGRSALIPINLSSHVLSMKEFTSPDALYQKLDSYAVEQ